jgi:hypothetical protein
MQCISDLLGSWLEEGSEEPPIWNPRHKMNPNKGHCVNCGLGLNGFDYHTQQTPTYRILYYRCPYCKTTKITRKFRKRVRFAKPKHVLKELPI